VMFRRQYERALRMLWEHRDRQRELSTPPTHPRRRKRNTFPDSPPLTPTDLPLPSPSGFPPASHPGFPSALAEGCIPPVPPDSPSASHPGFPSRLRDGCIPTVPPPTPETLAPQHPPNPKTAILRNEPKPAPNPNRCRAGAAQRAATKRSKTPSSPPFETSPSPTQRAAGRSPSSHPNDKFRVNHPPREWLRRRTSAASSHES
jgi:hypothetical protein